MNLIGKSFLVVKVAAVDSKVFIVSKFMAFMSVVNKMKNRVI